MGLTARPRVGQVVTGVQCGRRRVGRKREQQLAIRVVYSYQKRKAQSCHGTKVTKRAYNRSATFTLYSPPPPLLRTWFPCCPVLPIAERGGRQSALTRIPSRFSAAAAAYSKARSGFVCWYRSARVARRREFLSIEATLAISLAKVWQLCHKML